MAALLLCTLPKAVGFSTLHDTPLLLLLLQKKKPSKLYLHSQSCYLTCIPVLHTTIRHQHRKRRRFQALRRHEHLQEENFPQRSLLFSLSLFLGFPSKTRGLLVCTFLLNLCFLDRTFRFRLVRVSFSSK